MPDAANLDEPLPEPGRQTHGSGSRVPELFGAITDQLKERIIYYALALAALNIAAAWIYVGVVSARMVPTSQEVAALTSVAKQASEGKDAEAADPELTTSLFVHLADNQAQLKYIINRQALTMLGVGVGIAMLAIGYALFIVGADGAFKLQASQGKDSSVLLYGTAPGLLCLLLSAILVAISISHHEQLHIGNFTITSKPTSKPTSGTSEAKREQRKEPKKAKLEKPGPMSEDTFKGLQHTLK